MSLKRVPPNEYSQTSAQASNILTLLTSGINMFAAALVFNVLLGWSLNACIWLAAVFITFLASLLIPV